MFCSSAVAWAQAESFLIQGTTNIKNKGKYATVFIINLNENSLKISSSKIGGDRELDFQQESVIKTMLFDKIDQKPVIRFLLNDGQVRMVVIFSNAIYWGSEDGHGFLTEDLSALFDDFDFDNLYKAVEKKTK